MRTLLLPMALVFLLGCTSVPSECPACAPDYPGPEPPAAESTTITETLTENITYCASCAPQNHTVPDEIPEESGTEPAIQEPEADDARGGNEGIPFGGGRYVLVLEDVSVTPVSGDACGIFSIKDASSKAVLDRTVMCPGESHYWNAPDGHRFRMSVVKVAAGYTQEAVWADVRIFG